MTIAALAVFTHDAQMDNAVRIALSTPSIVADYVNSSEKMALHDQRAHYEVTISSGELRPQTTISQPLGKDEKKYIAKRRLMGTVLGNEYSWPIT